MDPTKEEIDLDLKELLEKIKLPDGYESASSSSMNDISYDSSPYTYSDSDTITLTGMGGAGSTVLNPGGLSGSYGQVYTVGAGANITSTSITGSNTSPWSVGTGSYTFPSTAVRSTIKLDGEGADIEINGKSLLSTLEALEERLNILVPNPEMEKEWDQLKKLGDKYRKLEKKLKEQSEMWNKLKAMPPPEIY